MKQTHEQDKHEDNKEPVSIHSIKKSSKNAVVCYVAKLRDYPGKLLPKVAISLGVPKGPMFRQLKDGQSVTLPSGKIIHPNQVTEAPIIGPEFLVIDCPAKKYISSVVKNETLKEYQVGGEGKTTMIVHIAEEDIINDIEYQDWMSSFHKDTYHCILDKKKLSKCPSVYFTQYGMQYQLNQVHADVFPLIETWRSPFVDDRSSKDTKSHSRTYSCRNLSKFNLRPKKAFGFDSSDELKQIDVGQIVQETLELLSVEPNSERTVRDKGDVSECQANKANNKEMNQEHAIKSAKCKRTMKDDDNNVEDEIVPASKICRCATNTKDVHLCSALAKEDKCNLISSGNKHNARFPFVVFLGTGSSIPSKYRNVTSILLHTGPNSTILLDCGEGSYGQIVNHYGNAAEDIIKKLQFVFISHLHADHHLGLIRILKIHWKQFGEKSPSTYTPILVAGPQRLSTWLKEYATTCESLRYRFVDCARLASEDSHSTISKYISEFSRVDIVPVDHHTEAYGFVLSHKDGWKITYSGDTEPCQSLVDAGKDSTLLIHEATFEDGMEEEAKEKHHSTCGQALEIAAKMNAKNVLLTHFSQRYAKLPVMKNGAPVAVAFDHMQVHPDDIPKISKLLPKLQILFPEESK